MSEILRPESPSITGKPGGTYRPDELNPELAQMSIAKDMLAKLPPLAIITDKHSAYQAIWKAINHNEGDEYPTYFDSTLRLRVFDDAAYTSVNKQGALFKAFWIFMGKSPYNIVMPGQSVVPGQVEEKPGLIERMRGWFGKKSDGGKE